MRRPPAGRKGERGVVMVLAAILLVALGAFMALSLNVGHGVAVRGELQNAVDSSALAGVRELNGTLSAITSAERFATDFAGRHVTDKDTQVVPQLIEFGNFDPSTSVWTQLDAVPENLYRINAIHVVAARSTDAPGGGALPVFFGRAFLDRDTMNVNAEAIAYAGAPCPAGSGCNSPFVIRYGCLVSGDVQWGTQYIIGLSSATIDSAGLSDMNFQPSIPGNPSANKPDICSALQALLAGTSTVSCSMGSSQVRTTNGTDLKATCSGGQTVCQLVQQLYPPGTKMRVPVVMYDDGALSCSSGQYGGVATVISTIEMQINGVYCEGSGTGGSICDAFATTSCIAMTPIEEGTNSQPGACVNLGAVTENAVLGR